MGPALWKGLGLIGMLDSEAGGRGGLVVSFGVL